ncbi:MAG: MBL fold metallo-hydrolase [Treponema sp.]|jgi:phosphoribosyl 1,2-cyclic phosphodiesterase|nr:MBL fold metallo-hydrolase [Treponema sp.]
MHIRFWGVRGSLPVPQLPAQIKSKISTIMERLTAADIESPETRERFLAGLPPWLFGTTGGNTACLTVSFDNPRKFIIFDAGSGIRELGNALARNTPKITQYHIFFSHFHWDHIMGLPFFTPAYDPAVSADFYSPQGELETVLKGQMVFPYFPVSMETMAAKQTFHSLSVGLTSGITLYDAVISAKKMNHPGGSYSYLVNDGKHRFVYATDVELSSMDFIKNEENIAFFDQADLVVIDSQYTLGEAIEKYSWGHSAFSMAVEFAAHWQIKHLVLFHHDPGYNDQKLGNILQFARRYAERINNWGITLTLATEGLELTVS